MNRGPILVVFGTRPEAIKMFPVVHALRSRGLPAEVCVTAQHRHLLDQVLDVAGIVPEHDLDLMQQRQSLDGLAARIVTGMGGLLDRVRPRRVLVHGDTLTTMMTSIAAYFRQIPVGHVEAGLRSGDIYHPWPEEVNRKVVAAIADLNFAPTEAARDALLREAVPAGRIHVTGNTVIDALLATRARLAATPPPSGPLADALARFEDRRIIAVTSHRRENWGAGMRAIASAIRRIAARGDVGVIFPVHPNPEVHGVMEAVLGDDPAVALIEPLDYPDFVRLLARCHIVLTDSGGIQEEAPSFGKPVLVMRETTERPEGVEAGTALLVGTDEERLVGAMQRLLDEPQAYAAMAEAHNPFGDGQAARRIVEVLAAES